MDNRSGNGFSAGQKILVRRLRANNCRSEVTWGRGKRMFMRRRRASQAKGRSMVQAKGPSLFTHSGPQAMRLVRRSRAYWGGRGMGLAAPDRSRCAGDLGCTGPGLALAHRRPLRQREASQPSQPALQVEEALSRAFKAGREVSSAWADTRPNSHAVSPPPTSASASTNVNANASVQMDRRSAGCPVWHCVYLQRRYVDEINTFSRAVY